MFALPTTLRRITDTASAEQLASLRFVLSAGSALPAGVRDALQYRLRVALHEAGGSSETGGGTYITDLERRLHPESVGRPMRGWDAWIARVGDAEDRLADGEVGEMVVSGDGVADGYIREIGSLDVFTDHVCGTGDLATRDEHGYFTIVGRISETVITGGMNVHITDVEREMRSMPGVGDVAVIGVASEQWGEAVCAFLVPRGAPPSVPDLIDRMKGFLAAYQVPKAVVVVDAIPETHMGKPDRAELRHLWPLKRLLDEATWVSSGLRE